MTDEKLVEQTTVDQNGKEEVMPLERAEFYFGRISYKQAREFNLWSREIAQSNLLLASEPKEDATREEKDSIAFAKSEAMEEMTALEIKRDAYLNRVIKSLPRAWLIEGAPTKIKDGEWLEWVRYDRMASLGEAYQSGGLERREELKN